MNTTPPTDEHVTSVRRALGVLDAFGPDDAHLALHELALRTRMAKTTVLRLARTLAADGYLVAMPSGHWRLGPATMRLATRYHGAHEATDSLERVLHDLAENTGHSASFFVLEGSERVRLARACGRSGFLSPSRVGESLPANRGAAGHVLLAFSGEQGAAHAAVRARGWDYTRGEAQPGIASVAVPVLVAHRTLLGALSLALREDLATADLAVALVPRMIEAAARLSNRTPAHAPDLRAETVTPRWFPARVG